jgi:hypothetical protein
MGFGEPGQARKRGQFSTGGFANTNDNHF